MSEQAAQPQRPARNNAPLRAARVAESAEALGIAVNYLMDKPAFAALPFGDWSSVLVGQIHRKHYLFVIDAAQRVQGFIGWAVAAEAKAQAWLESRAPLSFADSQAGDCIVFNAWSADGARVHRFMLGEARRLAQGKRFIYFKRHYPGGQSRPVKLSANKFISGHLARNADARAARARLPAAPQGDATIQSAAAPSLHSQLPSPQE
jgi:hemolysin-activating ACP:hemolysin acyltransferase